MIYAVIAILLLISGSIVAIYLRGRASARAESERDNAIVEVAERDAQIIAMREFERERDKASKAADTARRNLDDSPDGIGAVFDWLRRSDPRRASDDQETDVDDRA